MLKVNHSNDDVIKELLKKKADLVKRKCYLSNIIKNFMSNGDYSNALVYSDEIIEINDDITNVNKQLSEYGI